MLLLVLRRPMQWWDDFFHTRTMSSSSSISSSSSSDNNNNNSKKKKNQKSINVFLLCGRIRIAYAILLLCDRYILSYDFDYFFIDTPGIMPCTQYKTNQPTSVVSTTDSRSSILCTLLEEMNIHPNHSHYVYYILFYLGIINAFLLLFGISPKVQIVLLHINMISFHYHSNLIWDGEDDMFKLWNFLFIFIPLHHVTIYDRFRGIFYDSSTDSTSHPTTTTTTSTWPMWPFRLWQIEVCCIYIGAGYTKLSTTLWSSGNAMYSIIHTKDFFGGFFVPDFIFNRRGPLHLLTWCSLMIECGSIIFIWPKWSRNSTLIAIVALHLGIEGAMNMHCFEWLSIIGWLFFLVERQDNIGVIDSSVISSSSSSASQESKVTATTPNDTSSTSIAKISTMVTNVSRYMRLLLLNIFLLAITVTFLFDTIPFRHFAEMLPDIGYPSNILESILTSLDDFHYDVAIPYYYEPYLYPIGLHQDVWDLFTGTNDHNYRVETMITYDNGTSTKHWSPDWGNMTWYEKKRWQRPMTFYEHFADGACKDCFATHYATLYGPNVASVIITSHCEYPELEPPGNLLDMDYFFKPARETLVRREPEELFALNYCDDLLDACDDLFNEGHCESDDDTALFNMVVHCRYSCKICHYDAETLDVGSRIAVYFTSDERYFDGTVIKLKVLQHIRKYLVKYDGSEEEPEWITSISLRKKGVIILKTDENEMSVHEGSDAETLRADDSDENDHTDNEDFDNFEDRMERTEEETDHEVDDTADDSEDEDEDEEEGSLGRDEL